VSLDVFFTPAELANATALANRTVVVIDVLRATSTMVEALANGARSIFAVATTDEAVRIAQNIGRGDTILAGERKCVRIEGFDLGNSPLEFTRETVAGRQLIMTTTNGTGALAAVAAASRVLVASFLNVDAVARELAGGDGAIAMVCAGRERSFALEDAICAGALALHLYRQVGRRRNWSDATLAAAQLARRYLPSIERTLRRVAAGRQLIDLGFAADVEFCGQLDRYDVVPRYRDRQVTL
jgi:2-phosphosulfolactate phosphatase